MTQPTKQQHPHEISAAPPEGPLLQGFAVFHQEEHVEHKVQPCRSKVLSYYTPITISYYFYIRLLLSYYIPLSKHMPGLGLAALAYGML